MKIILVEDDPMISDMVISDLQLYFPNNELTVVGPASTYASAIELLHAERPDIALLDIDLNGDLNAGIRLAQNINQTRPIPIVFLSGLPRQSGFDIAKLTMPYGFLRKPYRYQDLIDQLELLMVRHSQKKLLKEDNLPSPPTLNKSIFVVTTFREITALPIKELVILEADGKAIHAHFTNREYKVTFNSPGLINFFEENRLALEKDFFQLSRKYIICWSKIIQVKDNHVILPKFSVDPNKPNYFRLSIPKNGDNRNRFFGRLGH